MRSEQGDIRAWTTHTRRSLLERSTGSVVVTSPNASSRSWCAASWSPGWPITGGTRVADMVHTVHDPPDRRLVLPRDVSFRVARASSCCLVAQHPRRRRSLSASSPRIVSSWLCAKARRTHRHHRLVRLRNVEYKRSFCTHRATEPISSAARFRSSCRSVWRESKDLKSSFSLSLGRRHVSSDQKQQPANQCW